MARYRLEMHDEAITRLVMAELQRRLARCALVILGHWKRLLNVDGTGVGPSGRLEYGAHPSKPGEAPRKQTGRLLASAAWELIGLVARIGTNLPYGRILELGGRFVAARPSLRVAAKLGRGECHDILSWPMKGP